MKAVSWCMTLLVIVAVGIAPVNLGCWDGGEHGQEMAERCCADFELPSPPAPSCEDCGDCQELADMPAALTDSWPAFAALQARRGDGLPPDRLAPPSDSGATLPSIGPPRPPDHLRVLRGVFLLI